MKRIHPSRSRCAGNSAGLPHAFSLVEVLVAIGVIGILVALALPALMSTRARAREGVCLANLHSTSAVLDMYLQRSAEVFPFAPPDFPLHIYPVEEDGDGHLITGDPWGLVVYWPSMFHDVAPWDEFFGSWVCRGSPRVQGKPWLFEDQAGSGIPSYRYCRSFQASPETWDGRLEGDRSLLKPVKLSMVTHPASKVIIFDEEMAHLAGKEEATDDTPRPMLFVDAHARTHRMSDATTPVRNPFLGSAQSLHDTPMGVRGHDY